MCFVICQWYNTSWTFCLKPTYVDVSHENCTQCITVMHEVCCSIIVRTFTPLYLDRDHFHETIVVFLLKVNHTHTHTPFKVYPTECSSYTLDSPDTSGTALSFRSPRKLTIFIISKKILDQSIPKKSYFIFKTEAPPDTTRQNPQIPRGFAGGSPASWISVEVTRLLELHISTTVLMRR